MKNQPDPTRIIEGLRDTGYTFNTSVADIIDNCISHGKAKNIWIDISMSFEGLITLTIIDEESFDIDYTVSQSDLALVDGDSQDTSMIVDFGVGPMTLDISYSYSNTLNFTRNTNGIVNNNIIQRVGNTNHSWPTKSRLPNILKDIK